MCGQLPPNQRRSTTMTDAPRSRALNPAASPAGPAPMITKSASMSLVCGLWRTSGGALPDRLIQQDGGRDRDVEAVGRAAHRDADRLHARVVPVGSEPLRLAAHDERDGA